jgi:hypothetical protein
VAVLGAAKVDREVFADESAAAVGEDGGRLIKHVSYHWLLLVEGHLMRRLFGAMVRRTEALPLPAG